MQLCTVKTDLITVMVAREKDVNGKYDVLGTFLSDNGVVSFVASIK